MGATVRPRPGRGGVPGGLGVDLRRVGGGGPVETVRHGGRVGLALERGLLGGGGVVGARAMGHGGRVLELALAPLLLDEEQGGGEIVREWGSRLGGAAPPGLRTCGGGRLQKDVEGVVPPVSADPAGESIGDAGGEGKVVRSTRGGVAAAAGGPRRWPSGPCGGSCGPDAVATGCPLGRGA